MPWYVYLAHFFAGAFLANGVPHFVHGVSGHKFQSPFAAPSGVGESSAIVNVLWGFANFAVGVGLTEAIGPFAGTLAEWIVLFAGALAISLFLARPSFRRGAQRAGRAIEKGGRSRPPFRCFPAASATRPPAPPRCAACPARPR